MMKETEPQPMARICRQQAALASTQQVRDVLTELAEHYEGEQPAASTVRPAEGPAEQG